MKTIPGLVLLVAGVVSACIPRTASAVDTEESFSDVLSTVGLGPEALESLAKKSEYNADDWQTISQLVYRLNEFSEVDLARWSTSTASQTGALTDLSGTITQVERVPTPTGLSADAAMPELFHCRLVAQEDKKGIVLVPQVPQRWLGKEIGAEPVRLRGVLVGRISTGEDVYVTNHLGWYPESGVPTGWLLLARQGMDVSLFDEVRHRQPFVKPDVSREGEAFYACLAAMAKADSRELSDLTSENVATMTKQFQSAKPELVEAVARLRLDATAETDLVKRERLQGELAQARRSLALAEAVERQAKEGLSSVAPMFLEPELQMGELVRIEGVARRAVRIAVPDSKERPVDLDAYYEMEIFTPDSQNLPVVCCVARLPAGFPVGDAIHEPVRLDGVFFKSWRYRSRKNLADSGETGRAQQLYTPVVVGGEPLRVSTPVNAESRWGFWGGIGFLTALAAIWIAMLRTAAEDRQRRAAAAPAQLENLPEGQ